MSTKKKQSTSAKQSKTSNSWVEALEAITINDDHWWCTMTMIVETVPSQARLIELFEKASENGNRRAIHVLTLKKLMSSVKSLSKIEENKCPVAQGVFHQASRLIARGENLEAWLVARLVKYLVYRAKMETLLRAQRETDIEHEIDRSIRALLSATNVESQRSMKSAKTKDSDKGFDVSVTQKSNTNLRKRGDVEKNKFYIDDSPEDGPHLFIILTGFRDPNFPLELMKAGLPLICVLKIKNPDIHETAENSEKILEEIDKVVESRESVFGKLTESELARFWKTFEMALNRRETIEIYSSVMIRNFCPPKVPSYDDHEEIEKYKKDLYDRVSYIVYDLYDLQSLHAEYLRSMKLLHIPLEPPGDSKIYMRIMNAIPAECSFVSVILQAMISQVEATIANEKFLDESVSDGNEITGSHEESLRRELSENKNDDRSSLTVDNNPGDYENNQRTYIREPNLLTRVIPKKLLSSSEVNRRVILERDFLESKTYHVPLSHDIIELVKPVPKSLAEFAERSFRNGKIIDLWKNRDTLTEDSKKKYQNCMKKIAQCFSYTVDSKKLIHYLHLRFFDEMIHDRFNRTFICHEDREGVIKKNKEVFPLATRSDQFPLTSRDIRTDRTLASGGDLISNLLTSKSDSIIDYHVAQGDILGFQEMLDAPKNSHKMLADLDLFTETGSEKVGKTRENSSYLEKFIDVRLLSSRTLLQAVHECFQEYQRFYSEYSEITDSMLLCFGHVDKPRKSSEAKQNEEERLLFYDYSCPLRTLKMVTPVCLRNFSEYVIHEEKDFIRDVEKFRSGKRSMSAGELTRKLSQHSDIGIPGVTTFNDDDFILPDSLKGQARRKNTDSKASTEIDIHSKKIDSRQTIKSIIDNKTKKNKSSEKKNSSEKSLTSVKTPDIHGDSMRVRKMPSLRCAGDDEPYKFLGYDIGTFRVHLTTGSETFASPDGTLVKVDLDEWLYEKRFLAIGINLQGTFLKVQRPIGRQENQNQAFHLITKNGIVMAFSQVSRVYESANLEKGQSSVAFEFEVSWPSGLLAKIVRGDSFENPFYIQQRYVSKGSECENVSGESYRKFLRNGTVLKFLGDNEIEVLRPNSTIVRCFEYDKFSGEFASRSNANVSKEEFLKSPKKKYSMTTRGKRKSSSAGKSIGRDVEAERTRKRLNDESSVEPSFGEIYSPKEDAARIKITRYIALEHDGRRYEVENDEVSRVYDRSLVRTSTDVETCEKFTRRDDGTRSVLNSRGELLVSFPDGTQIITGYMIEEEPLLCDWSDDEFTRFFGSDPDVNLIQRQNDDAISSGLSNVTRTDSYRSEFHRPTNPDDRVEMLLSEGFVSVLLACRIEHECYATVVYEPIKNSCQLSMPDEVEIEITREAFFDIRVGQATELSIRDDKLTFSSEMCTHGRSVSIYNLRETILDDEAMGNSDTLLITTDSRGKIFEVKVDGTIIRDDHSSSNPLKKAHRFFAVNRDLTGFEYLDECQRDHYPGRINWTEKSESIFIPVSTDGLPEYRLFLNPLEPIDFSKKWLLKIKSIVKRNPERVDLLRSTYADPYDWIFPFGKGVTNEKKTQKSMVQNNNEVLTLDLLIRIANEGDTILDEVEKAIARCRRMPNKTFDDYPSSNDESFMSNYAREIEKCVENLLSGIDMNISVIADLRGLSKKIIDEKSDRIDEFSKPSKQKQQASIKTKEFEWYERCFRERIILPYFKSIQGSCFLWITDCVNGALQLVE